MWLVFVSLIALLLLTWQLNKLVLPIASVQRKGHVLTLFSISPVLIYFASILMLTYRPIFAGIFTIASYSVIVLLNNAKVKAVREPFVYSDFHLFREVVKHPHLYVKYIDVPKFLFVLAAGITAVISALFFEKPVIERNQFADYLPLFLFFGILFGVIYLIAEGPLKKPFRKILLGFGPTANVSKNVSQLGLVVCLIFYFVLAREESIKAEKSHKNNKKTNNENEETPATVWGKTSKLPNIVAIQAESFFDIRYLQAGLDTSMLENYDAALSQASFHGRLDVPAWGAFTMRTEFAFLSGLPESVLGQHKFNPYLQLANKPFWTIAHNLKLMGYKTICIHPFPATFFNRKKVFPNLGFDQFIDMEQFKESDQFGPYIGDIALGEKIIETLDVNSEPVFIFAITMENHGAWSKDRLGDTEGVSSNKEHWPLGCYSLNHYIRHMRNTDQMIGNLIKHFDQSITPSVFCLYGDHMPNLQNAFNKTGYSDTKTDYFIWRKDAQRERKFDTSADLLGRLLLDVALNERTDNSPNQMEKGSPILKA